MQIAVWVIEKLLLGIELGAKSLNLYHYSVMFLQLFL